MDEGAEDGGECFYFFARFLPNCPEFFATTATALFTNSCRKCCMLSAGRDVASFKHRRARKVQRPVQCSHFSGNICPPVGMEQFISFKQRWSKETALLGLSVEKKTLPTTLV